MINNNNNTMDKVYKINLRELIKISKIIIINIFVVFIISFLINNIVKNEIEYKIAMKFYNATDYKTSRDLFYNYKIDKTKWWRKGEVERMYDYSVGNYYLVGENSVKSFENYLEKCDLDAMITGSSMKYNDLKETYYKNKKNFEWILNKNKGQGTYIIDNESFRYSVESLSYNIQFNPREGISLIIEGIVNPIRKSDIENRFRYKRTGTLIVGIGDNRGSINKKIKIDDFKAQHILWSSNKEDDKSSVYISSSRKKIVVNSWAIEFEF